jgi:hypothetical protein
MPARCSLACTCYAFILANRDLSTINEWILHVGLIPQQKCFQDFRSSIKINIFHPIKNFRSLHVHSRQMNPFQRIQFLHADRKAHTAPITLFPPSPPTTKIPTFVLPSEIPQVRQLTVQRPYVCIFSSCVIHLKREGRKAETKEGRKTIQKMGAYSSNEPFYCLFSSLRDPTVSSGK